MTVSRDEVVWAYRMILGRDPESEAVIDATMNAPDVATLRQNLLSSDEFKRGYRKRPPSDHSIDREDQARKHIDRHGLGIEIGAWFNPLVPKSAGYDSLSLDVFDTAELRRRAESDPNISAEQASRIQDVDFVGSVTDLDTLVAGRGISGQVDYIISAHNFEHIPDPVRFFQACQTVLRPGGVLTMIIPDRRTCFDFLRPRSTTGQFIDAFLLNRDKPTPGQIFDHFSLFAENHIDGVGRSGWSREDDTANLMLTHEIGDVFATVRDFSNPDYVDAHCWVLTPDVFRSIVSDLQEAGLVRLDLIEIVVPGTHEFFVSLRNGSPGREDAFRIRSRQERTASAYAIATDI